MPHSLLQQLDTEYKEKRAKLIADNYDAIVGEIHHFFQTNIIKKIALDMIVKEIIKFDYMTNLKSDGDKHIWIHFVDTGDVTNTLHITLDKRQNRCLFNDTNFSLEDIQLSVETVDTLSKLCLSEFRRGYDKPNLKK